MFNKKTISFITVSIFLLLSRPVFAGFIFQNFEPDNGSPLVTTSIGPVVISSVDRTEGVHLGIGAIKTESPHYWTGFGVQSQVSSVVDLKQNNNDRLTFWTLAFPHRNCYVYGCDNGTDNTVSVRFFDTNLYAQNGFEVWTTNTAKYDQWTKLWVLFSQLPPDFDLTHVTRIEFKNYWPGKYYFDDIHAVREDRVYQSFEKERRSGSPDSEYGWKWNDVDSVGTSAPGEPAYEGAHSWKLVAQGNWSGTGIQSQEKRFIKYDNGNVDQTFWNVDLNPTVNDRLTLWVYALPANGLDNNLAVQFYDNNLHFTDATKAVVWTKEAAHAGAWTRLTVLFKDLPPTLNLRDINKIQIQHYWPGTFYIDNMKATGPTPVIKEAALSQETIQWDAVPGALNYRLQESLDGPMGPWRTIYSGLQPNYSISRLSKTWLRVRWEETFTDHHSLPYASDWSDVVEYNPPAVVLKYKSLQNGNLEWSAIPQTSIYEIERADQKAGPWTLIYKGNVPASLMAANLGKWYRIRAVQEINGSMSDATAWSRPQRAHPVGQGYVKAAGTMLKELNGIGDELILKGVNLGNEFLIEDWMTGIGTTDSPVIPDDWTVRNVLTTRFGNTQANALLKTFQDSYLQSFDFDRLLSLGFNVVRLPIYYRNLQDDAGTWILNAQGQIDFSAIDRIVDALADRGIYTIIDLHGAPGAQSAEFHTGRKNFNRLFNTTAEGQTYRTRTVDLWKEIARHYKNNTWVVGYDLLNEPVGAPTPQILWDLYDQIYDAIRVIDPDHLIMMEGIWDWNTLPNPSTMSWSNVLYQFHFYYWDHDDNFPAHKTYIDGEMAKAQLKQPVYNVPVMIGEFHGYGLKSIWEYYLSNFNAQKWSWVLWSYKIQSSPSNWGIYNQPRYDEDLPKLRTDSYSTLSRKFSKYTTADYHVPNPTVISLLRGESNTNNLSNNVKTSSVLTPSQNSLTVTNLPGRFALGGTNFGDTPGTVAFYWAPCNDYPPGSIPCNNGQAGITYWSNTLIEGYIPPDAIDLSRINLQSTYGGELYPTMIGDNFPPILHPIANKLVQATKNLNFIVNATDLNNDALTFTTGTLPSGATFNATTRTFNWTPTAAQVSTTPYTVRFNVSDGKGGADYKDVQITVVPLGQAPSLTIPVLGGTIDQANLTFSWNKGDATSFFLSVGTSFNKVANAPYGDIYHSGWGNFSTANVTGIPLNGNTVYVRLWYVLSGVTSFKDYAFATVNRLLIGPSLTTPASGTTIDQLNMTFGWNKGDSINFFLSVGTSLNNVANAPYGDIYQSGWGNFASANVTGIPLNGKTLYVRLWYVLNGVTSFKDYTFGTVNRLLISPSLTTPGSGTTIGQSTQMFSWNKGDATNFFLSVGTSLSKVANAPYGDIYQSGWGNFATVNVTGIPLNGNTVYVRLWYVLNGVTSFKDYSFVTVNRPPVAPSLTTPASGTTIGQSTQMFSWNKGDATNFFLSVGTSLSKVANAPYGDIYQSGWGNFATVNVTGIPLNGNTVYVRLWYVLNGVTSFKDYTFATLKK